MDRYLLTIQIVLGAFGVLAVATGRPELGLEQAARVILGLLATIFVARIPAIQIVKISPYAYILTLFLLLAVIFFGSSPIGSESKRWLSIGESTFQPSEFMKVAIIAYLASLLLQPSRGLADLEADGGGRLRGRTHRGTTRHQHCSVHLRPRPRDHAGGRNPDGKTRKHQHRRRPDRPVARWLVPQPVQLHRQSRRGVRGLVTEREHTDSLSFQSVMAQRTLQRAGFLGIGPGHLTRVPESWTDMVAVNIAQALGLTGIATITTLFILFAVRGLQISSRLSGPSSILAAGATAYICGQAGLNLLVSAGLVPVTGISLPFVSYGLNSLISVSVAAGFLHSGFRALPKEPLG